MGAELLSPGTTYWHELDVNIRHIFCYPDANASSLFITPLKDGSGMRMDDDVYTSANGGLILKPGTWVQLADGAFVRAT